VYKPTDDEAITPVDIDLTQPEGFGPDEPYEVTVEIGDDE
jgi:hypothetical protein